MKKLDEAIDRVVKASEGLHVEKYTCVPEWQRLLVAVLGLLAAIAEWRKPPPGQGTAFDRLAAAMLDLRKRDEAIGEALRAWYGWLDAREAAPVPAGPRVRVAILATDPGDRILLVRTARGWELPGGKVEDEPWEDAARREAREETGLEVVLAGAPQVLNGEPVNGASYRSVVLVARARAEGQPTAGDDALEARWFTRAELPWGALSELVSVEALRAWAVEQAEPVRHTITPAGGSWSAAVARALGTPESPPDGYAARRAQGETGHGMVLPAEQAPHVITNGKADRPGSGLFGRLTGEELQAAHAAHFARLDAQAPAAEMAVIEPECECTSLRGGDSPEDHDDACPVNPRNKS